MQTFYIELKSQLSQDIRLLTYLRLVLDKPNDLVDIEQDIRDLFGFPERLLGSYRTEWLHYCLPQLAKCIPDIFTNEIQFIAWLEQQSPRFESSKVKELLTIVDQVSDFSEKLVPFPTPLRNYVYQLLKL